MLLTMTWSTSIICIYDQSWSKTARYGTMPLLKKKFLTLRGSKRWRQRLYFKTGIQTMNRPWYLWIWNPCMQDEDGSVWNLRRNVSSIQTPEICSLLTPILINNWGLIKNTMFNLPVPVDYATVPFHSYRGHLTKMHWNEFFIHLPGCDCGINLTTHKQIIGTSILIVNHESIAKCIMK